MYTKITAAVALAASLAMNNAQAGPFLDFEGVGNGAQILDFYNGGTDSQGNHGVNYGVHFSSGAVAYNQYGAYVTGHAVMTFSPNIVPVGSPAPFFQIGFLATNFDDEGAFSQITGPSGYNDGEWVNGIANPFCSVTSQATYEQCKKQGWAVIPLSDLFGNTLYSDGTANTVYFNTDALDSIEFGVLQRPADRRSDVPEPATIVLLGLGFLSFTTVRKRKQ